MDTKFAKESFSGMPSWAKGVIGIGLLLGAGYLVYKFLKVPSKIKEGEGNRQEDRAVNTELDKLISQGKAPSLSKAQLLGIANKIDTAMQGYGTDFMAIMNAFSLVKNYSDVLGVIQAFGRRTIKSGKLNPAPDLEGVTLTSALADELDFNQTQMLNKLLASKKINYKF